MKRYVIAAMVIAGVVGTAPSADEVVEQATGVTAESFEGLKRIDIRLPGRLIRHTAPKQGDGSCSLMMLVGDALPPPPEGELPPEVPPCSREMPGNPLSLWRLAPPGGSQLELMRDDVPADSVGLLSRDLDGDGRDELLLVRPGELYVLPPTAGEEPRLLLRDPSIGSWSGWSGESNWLPVADVGGTRFRRMGSPDDEWHEVSVELPIRASRLGSRLQISSSTPLFIGRDAEGLELYTTPPEPFGDRRIRSFVIRPGADPEAHIEESWASLPGPERMIGWNAGMLDGQPVLVVRTMPAEAMSLFGELLVRIYPLKRDRSRTGHLPLAAFKSRINMLQSDSVRISFRDVDGDAQQDLVLVARQGFDGDKVVLDAYTRKADGSFRDSARTTVVKIKSEEASLIDFGTDFDADGQPDLRVRTEEAIHIFPGVAGKKRLVADRPSYSAPLPEFATQQAAIEISISSQGRQSVNRVGDRRAMSVDLEGDGVSELLVIGTLADGRGAIGVVRFTGDASR